MKYYGIAGLGALLITGIVGWQVLAPGQKINSAEPVEQMAGDTAAKLDQDLLRTKQLAASLDGIAARAFEPRSNAPVIGFVRMSEAEKMRRASNPGGFAMDGEGDEVPQYQREVSLLYSGRGFNRAVVDGKYIRSGGTLPDGSKVVKITRDSVVIKTPEGRKVLRVKDPRTVRPVVKEQKP